MKTKTKINTNAEQGEIKNKETKKSKPKPRDKRERKIIYKILNENFVTANLKYSESSFIYKELMKK